MSNDTLIVIFFLFFIDLTVDDCLTKKDIPEIITKLYDVHGESEKFGTLLKLPQSTVDAIHIIGDCDPLFDVAEQFINQNPRPTWKIVLEALRDPCINNPDLAENIEKMRFSMRPGIMTIITESANHNNYYLFLLI